MQKPLISASVGYFNCREAFVEVIAGEESVCVAAATSLVLRWPQTPECWRRR